MKSTRFAAYAAAVIALLFALVIIGGCGGGAKTQVVKSPWYGDLYGVATGPEDGDTAAPIDAWIRVYWPDSNYPPPATFTMTLEKEESLDNWGLVHTTLDNATSDPEGGLWWFQPVSNFSPGTWYRITISVPGFTNSAVAYFQTAGTRGAAVSSLGTKAPANGKSYRPAGSANATGETSATHTINVKK